LPAAPSGGVARLPPLQPTSAKITAAGSKPFVVMKAFINRARLAVNGREAPT
jgi:hypothetical protein